MLMLRGLEAARAGVAETEAALSREPASTFPPTRGAQALTEERN